MIQTIKSLALNICHTTHQIGHRLSKLGWMQGLRKMHTIQGLERGASFVIPLFGLLQPHSGQRLDKWLEITERQKSFYQITFLIPRLFKAVEEPSVSRILKAAISLCEAGTFLHTHEIYSFKVLDACANRLGGYSIFQSFFGRHILKRPQDLLLLILCLWKLSHLFQEKSDQELKTLHGLHRAWRVVLIFLRSYAQEGMVRFGTAYNLTLDLVTINTEAIRLVSFLIKK